MRVLRVARASVRKGRTQALNQMRSLISTGPDRVRAELRGLNVYRMLERASSYRPGTKREQVSINKPTLRMLARRAIELEEEIREIDSIFKPMVEETAPELSALSGVGTDIASALLVAAGDKSGEDAQ
jgi:transposase